MCDELRRARSIHRYMNYVHGIGNNRSAVARAVATFFGIANPWPLLSMMARVFEA